MKTQVVNRKYLVLILVTVLIGFGSQGSYGQTITASVPQPLTEANLHGSIVTLTLSGGTYRSRFRIRDAVMVSGIDGVTFESRDVDRVSDTEVTVELTFSGNIDTDTPLVFTVGAGAIADYNGAALTAQVPVTAVAETLVVTTAAPLTEATLGGNLMTLTLSGRSYDSWRSDIERALTISGIDGVTVNSIRRVSDTIVTITLTFSGNIDADSTLAITLGAGAITNYNQAFTVQLPVTAVEESLVASTAAPLTEATLSGSVVTLTLSGRAYDSSSSDIERALIISGIEGVTVGTFDVVRVSDTKVTVELTFSGNIDTNTPLVFTVGAGAIADYNGAALTAQVPVTAVAETLVATTAAPLTEATLNGSVVTLTLSGRRFTTRVWVIERALTISGIDGGTVGTFDVVRVSDTKVTVELTFSGNIDADSTLAITLGAGAITNYNQAFTVQLPVTAVEESLVASTAAPLTEVTLSGSVVTLTLSGRAYDSSSSDIERALTISSIEGVTVSSVRRVSDTIVTITLTFSGNIDADSTLAITLGANAIGYNQDFTVQLPVTAVEESLVATTAAPLAEATLSGSVVTLTLSGRSFILFEYYIERAFTVSGIEGVTVGTFDVVRISNTRVTVTLTFSGNIDTDSTLTLTVGANAIIGYNKEFTFEFPVTAVEESLVATTEAPLTEATLSGSVVTLTLSGRSFTRRFKYDIERAFTVSGIEGVAVDQYDVGRISNTRVTVPLTFSGNIDTDATLTIVVSAGVVVGYNEAFTVQLPVTAVAETLVATTAAPLTETTLHGSVVTLIFSGRIYAKSSDQIEEALTVSGIEGVTVSDYPGVQRVSDTEVTVELAFAGDFDTDATLTFTVSAEAIAEYNVQAYTAQSPVTATMQSNATVSISPSPMIVPAIREQFTLSLNITNGEKIAGYQATVSFDDSALRYVESAKGDYLPADAFFISPIVKSDWIGDTSFGDPIFDRNVTLAGNTLAGVGNGDGTLAILTFEVIDFKASTLTLSQVYLIDSDGERWEVTTENGEVTEPPEPTEKIFGDINRDGVVNIQDLAIVGSRFSQRGQNSADLNGDGIVNIVDLVLVAGAFDAEAAAPSAQPQTLELLTAAEVRQWLSQAQQLTLMNPAYLRGITILEQLLTALVPTETVLLPNYPNPFNPETWIPYHLAKGADVTLTIYNTAGAVVRSIDVGYKPAAVYESRSKAIYWDGKNEFGEQVARAC